MVSPKSTKQRRLEIDQLRARRDSKRKHLQGDERRKEIFARGAACNPALLAPHNSYGVPDFVERGFYVDIAFKCADCDKEEIWRATQQKWWYEVQKGDVYSTATRCRGCRRKERERKGEARRVHLDGLKRRTSDRQQT